MPTQKVLLADDHKILREGLKNILEGSSAYEVIGEASDGREAVKLAEKLSPDIIVMDIAMPGLNGVDATIQIKKYYPDIKIVALSMHADRQYVAGMFKAGADAYLMKDCAMEELNDALSYVSRGQHYVSPKISGIVIQELSRKDDEPVKQQLSDREREVLQLLAEGKSVKYIAEALILSNKTIETHRKNIMDKLDIHSLPELTKYAIRMGYTSLDS